MPYEKHSDPALGDDDWEQQMLTGRMLSPLPSIASIGHGHISYRELSQAVEPDVVASYFTFAIVRHPIERFMSVCASWHVQTRVTTRIR